MSETGEPDEIQSADTLRDRVGLSGFYYWFLLEGNRFAVTGLIAGAVFAAFVLASVLLVPSLEVAIRSADTVETMFSTMIGSVLTGTTLVVTISQLVISQENGPLGDQRKRMSDSMDFRTYATELFETPPEADPAEFLRQLLESNERRADALEERLADNDDEELRRQVGELLDDLRENAEVAKEKLDGAKFGTFEVLNAALDYNYARKIYQIERITQEFADSLDDGDREAFHSLDTALTMFGPAREQFKTLYFQWELVDLSRYILYAAVPAVVVAGSMLAFVGAETFAGTTLGVPSVTWVVGAAFTVTLVPFLLFLTYILRIVVVAKHTLAIGPFILRQSYGEDE